jgi:glycosyltransferase involved in cell wall biosynthesis
MTGQLLARLADGHEVGALFLRDPDEPPIAPELAARLALVESLERPSLRGGTGARRNARRAIGLAGGRPLWATDWRVPPLGGRVGELVSAWSPSVVQAELMVMGQYLSAVPGPGPATVLVDHDPGNLAAAGAAARERGLRRAARLADATAWRRYARRCIGAADATVAFTDSDAQLLRGLDAGARVVRIAPGVVVPNAPADPVGAQPPRVLFLGSFVHPPNVEAALRLAGEIIPAVRARVPDARLEIVGDAPPRAVRALARDGVTVTGRVPDTRPHLEAAAVVAAPLSLGRGVRVKVLETLAAGKALVATPRAVDGLGLEPGVHALLGERDAELADALADLLEDPARRRRVGTAAREWAREHLDWGHAVACYERLWDSLEQRA